MAVSEITLANFKGFDGEANVEIKPITIFYGKNSSGKSSCIHAITSLAQSIKLSKQSAPLVLDDEFADVHLGRFRDVAHSGTYEKPISLGFSVKDTVLESLEERESDSGLLIRRSRGDLSAKYSFTCSRKTQQIYLQRAQFQIGAEKYEATRKGSSFVYSLVKNGVHLIDVGLDNSFVFSRAPISMGGQKIWAQAFSFFYAQKIIARELSNVRYLGPFRQPPQRQYPTRGANPVEVGAMGESTVTLLANESIRSKTRPAKTIINGWLQAMNIAQEVNVSRLGTSDQFSTTFTLNDGQALSISDLGYGVSQILPVLTQCAVASKGSTLLFEQPEIHLHSLSARELANVFLDTVKEKSSNIILETHSDDLVHGLQKEMRDRGLSNDDIVLYKIERINSESVITKVSFDDYFDASLDWRRGCTQS